MTKAVKKTTTQAAKSTLPKPVTFHVPDSTPAGTALFTYTLAVMTVLDGFTAGRKQVKKTAIQSFWNGKNGWPTFVTYHANRGNIEKKGATFRLTVAGWNYFQGRLTGATSGQKVEQSDVDNVIKAITSGDYKDSVLAGRPHHKVEVYK